MNNKFLSITIILLRQVLTLITLLRQMSTRCFIKHFSLYVLRATCKYAISLEDFRTKIKRTHYPYNYFMFQGTILFTQTFSLYA